MGQKYGQIEEYLPKAWVLQVKNIGGCSDARTDITELSQGCKASMGGWDSWW